MDSGDNCTKLSDLNEDCLSYLFRFLSLKDKANFAQVCVEWMSYDRSRVWNISKLTVDGINDDYWIVAAHNDSSETLNLTELRNILLSFGPELQVLHLSLSNKTDPSINHVKFDDTMFRIVEERDYDVLFDILIETCCNLKTIDISNYCSEQEPSGFYKLHDLLQANQQLEILHLRYSCTSTLKPCIGDHNIRSSIYKYLSSYNGKLIELKIDDNDEISNPFLRVLAANSRELRILHLTCRIRPLTSINTDSINAMKTLSALENLEELKIEELPNQMTDEVISAISSGCKKLETIVLQGCPEITVGGLNALIMALPNLKTLELGRREAMPILYEDVQSNLRSLRVIFTSLLVEPASIIKGFKHLEELAITDMFDMEDDHLLAMTSSCKQLKKLELCISSIHSDVTENGIHAALTALPNLVTLELRAEGLESFLYGGGISNLQNLELIHVNPTFDASKNISCENLKNLSIWRSSIRDDVMIAISVSCKKLESLRLDSCNYISTTAINALLTNLPNLDTVILAFMKFETENQRETHLDVNPRNMNCNLRNLRIHKCCNLSEEALKTWILMSPRLKTLIRDNVYLKF